MYYLNELLLNSLSTWKRKVFTLQIAAIFKTKEKQNWRFHNRNKRKEQIEIQWPAAYSITISRTLAQTAVSNFCLKNQQWEGCSAQPTASLHTSSLPLPGAPCQDSAITTLFWVSLQIVYMSSLYTHKHNKCIVHSFPSTYHVLHKFLKLHFSAFSNIK